METMKHSNLACLDQYMHRGFRLWNSQDYETVYVYKYTERMETMKHSDLACLDQYMHRGFRLWNSQDYATVYVYKYTERMETMKQSDPWRSLCTHGSVVVMW